MKYKIFSNLPSILDSKKFNSACNIVFWITIPLLIVLILYAQDIKVWRIKSFQEQKQKENEPPLITCNQCKGSGEYPTDINKLMMDANLALFINHHLMVDKCTKCVKMPYGDAYDYCDTVQDKYQILVQEYAAVGPKIDMAACEECMGMGQFTSVKKDGSYMTQEEYNETH